MARKKKKTIDTGKTKDLVNPAGISAKTPCAIDLEMSLLRMPPGQVGQMKKMMEVAFTITTKHIDFLHRQVFTLKEQNDALEKRLVALEPKTETQDG